MKIITIHSICSMYKYALKRFVRKHFIIHCDCLKVNLALSVCKMYKTNFILLLNLFAIFKAVNTTNNSKFLDPVPITQADDDSSSSNTFKEALPIIVFENEQTSRLEFPTNIVKANIHDGRLISGTKFQQIPQANQIFLCPNPDSVWHCLEPTTFLESQPLQCDHEPIPVIVEDSEVKSCGPDGTDTRLSFVYKVCPALSPYTYNTRHLLTYSFCRDESDLITLFVEYEIVSVNLLSEKLLQREREIHFDLSTESYGLIYTDYKVMSSEKTFEVFSEYQFQKLVPAEDMALAAFKKTTYHYLNIDLQHKKLFNLWNGINSLIRNNAKETLMGPHKIITGILNVPIELIKPLKQNKSQMYNIWIKMIIDKNTESFKGLAILMNNYITINEETETSNRTGDNSTQKQHYVDQVCDKNISCVESLNKKFDDVGGQVRCCEVTEQILRLFGTNREIISVGHVLHFRDITYNTEN